jgi:hypothetical protein
VAPVLWALHGRGQRPTAIPDEPEIRGIEIFRVQGGKLRERWGVIDRLGMMQQLGLMPAEQA